MSEASSNNKYILSKICSYVQNFLIPSRVFQHTYVMQPTKRQKQPSAQVSRWYHTGRGATLSHVHTKKRTYLFYNKTGKFKDSTMHRLRAHRAYFRFPQSYDKSICRRVDDRYRQSFSRCLMLTRIYLQWNAALYSKQNTIKTKFANRSTMTSSACECWNPSRHRTGTFV